MANTTDPILDEQRPGLGEGIPPGRAGDGNAGVPAREQPNLNRPENRDGEIVAQENEDDQELEDDEDEDVDDDEDDDLEDEEDETTDPGSEPGKPV